MNTKTPQPRPTKWGRQIYEKTKKRKQFFSYVSVFSCFRDSQQGLAALFIIVILTAAIFIMAYSASLLGLGELDMSYTAQKGAEVFSIADGCMEEALHRLKIDLGYNGDSLNLGSGSCIISVETNENIRTITITANIDEKYYKKIQSNVTIDNREITVNSWEEKDN
ncbi:MAG: hypothetical protein ABIE43_01960 [Patescibacteria group bacterium]